MKTLNVLVRNEDNDDLELLMSDAHDELSTGLSILGVASPTKSADSNVLTLKVHEDLEQKVRQLCADVFGSDAIVINDFHLAPETKRAYRRKVLPKPEEDDAKIKPESLVAMLEEKEDPQHLLAS